MKTAQFSSLFIFGVAALAMPLEAMNINRSPLPSASKTCRASSKATDNFDDPKYGAVPLSDINFALHPNTKGSYVTYTDMEVGSDAGLNNLPPPSGHDWVGTIQGGIVPNAGYNAFHLFRWSFACTLRTLVQDVNVIPSCKISISCTEGETPGKKRQAFSTEAKKTPIAASSTDAKRNSGDAKRQSFSYVPDGKAGLTGHFISRPFDSDFQTADLSICSVTIDKASKVVNGVSVPLDPSTVVALFDDVVTSGVKCI